MLAVYLGTTGICPVGIDLLPLKMINLRREETCQERQPCKNDRDNGKSNNSHTQDKAIGRLPESSVLRFEVKLYENQILDPLSTILNPL